MTLIIAGHQRGGGRYGNENGLFVAADGAITQVDQNGNVVETLLNGFQKISPITINLWTPHFIGQCFNDYLHIGYTTQCFVAFAGSTFVSQHVINCIEAHLGKLRISMKYLDEGGFRYILLRDCDKKNNMLYNSPNDNYDEELFCPRDIDKIYNVDDIVDVVEYSINQALLSLRKHCNDSKGFSRLNTEFIVGLSDRLSDKHRLFLFKTSIEKDDDGLFQPKVIKTEIFENDVVLIGGAKKHFEDRAHIRYAEAISGNLSREDNMFNFLNECISEASGELGRKEIAFPSSLKTLVNGRLDLIKHKS